MRCFLVMLCALAVVAQAQTPEEPDSKRDTLVYKDGDRVHGQLVEKTADLIVFKSERFGELRVAANDAVVIKATKETPPAITKQVVAQGIREITPAPTAAETAEEEKVSIWNVFSPAVLTARVREFFGPWHGRIALSNDVLVESSTRESVALDTKLARKFKRDNVELTARYDYNETNDEPTTDVLKATGSWRHEFSKRYFGHYRPTVEWNRGSTRRGVRSEYVLVQQELGLGVHILSTPARKLRFGVSENVFDIWSYAPAQDHGSRSVGSLFDELELALPWRMSLTQRGIWYPVADQTDGWENKVELNKKLTETLSVAVRHELRRNNPDGASNDYTRLKLLLGFDF